MQGSVDLTFLHCLTLYITTCSNTDERVKNMTRSGIFLTSFEVLENVVTLCGVFDILFRWKLKLKAPKQDRSSALQFSVVKPKPNRQLLTK